MGTNTSPDAYAPSVSGPAAGGTGPVSGTSRTCASNSDPSILDDNGRFHPKSVRFNPLSLLVPIPISLFLILFIFIHFIFRVRTSLLCTTVLSKVEGLPFFSAPGGQRHKPPIDPFNQIDHPASLLCWVTTTQSQRAHAQNT